MQIAVIEYARNVCGLDGANSTEFNPDTQYPVVGLIEEWVDEHGNKEQRSEDSDLVEPCVWVHQVCHLFLVQWRKIYGSERIEERHRHRYESNNNFYHNLKRRA